MVVCLGCLLQLFLCQCIPSCAHRTRLKTHPYGHFSDFTPFLVIFQVKLKKITNVTMNVLDKHHNHLKDALIAVKTFLGVQGQTDIVPFGSTLTGRINFLKKILW